jgi:hypothetical protein
MGVQMIVDIRRWRARLRDNQHDADVRPLTLARSPTPQLSTGYVIFYPPVVLTCLFPRVRFARQVAEARLAAESEAAVEANYAARIARHQQALAETARAVAARTQHTIAASGQVGAELWR